METLVVRSGIERPGCENQKSSLGASIKTALLRFPELGNRFLLQKDERQTGGQSSRNNSLFALGDSWCHEDCTFFAEAEQAGTLGGILLSEVGRCAVGVLPMEEDLDFIGVLQEEEIAEGGIFAIVNPQVEASLHDVWALAADDSTKGVLVHIAADILQHPVPNDDAVVIARLKKNRPPDFATT